MVGSVEIMGWLAAKLFEIQHFHISLQLQEIAIFQMKFRIICLLCLTIRSVLHF